MPNVGSLARRLLPGYAYARLRALRGDFQYQERLGKLTPPWTAYGLLMAVRAARKMYEKDKTFKYIIMRVYR